MDSLYGIYLTNFTIFAVQTWYAFAKATAYTAHLRKFYGVHGRLTEWLGSGLQNRLRRFESATDLNKEVPDSRDFFINYTTLIIRTFRVYLSQHLYVP